MQGNSLNIELDSKLLLPRLVIANSMALLANGTKQRCRNFDDDNNGVPSVRLGQHPTSRTAYCHGE